jgi:chaperonin GroES
MAVILEEKDIEKFILVGDRILIKPKSPDSKTKSGLYLPPTVQEKEAIQTGYVVKVGPGYPIPALTEVDEVWKNQDDEVKYIPLQAHQGDFAIYLQSAGHQIEFNNHKYVILPHSAVLLLIRDDGLLE